MSLLLENLYWGIIIPSEFPHCVTSCRYKDTPGSARSVLSSPAETKTKPRPGLKAER